MYMLIVEPTVPDEGYSVVTSEDSGFLRAEAKRLKPQVAAGTLKRIRIVVVKHVILDTERGD